MNEHEQDQPRNDPEPAPADYEPPQAEDVSGDDRVATAAGGTF